MTLIFSMWDDHAAHMLWLDSNYPPGLFTILFTFLFMISCLFTLLLVTIAEGDPSKPGVARGPCPTSSGVPSGLFTILCLNFFVYTSLFTFLCLQLQKLKNNKLMPLLLGVILVMDLLAQLSKWIFKFVKKKILK